MQEMSSPQREDVDQYSDMSIFDEWLDQNQQQKIFVSQIG